MVEFRMYSEKDIDQCTELFLKVFSKEPWLDNWGSFDRAKAYLEDIINTPGFKGYVAEYEDKVIGLILGHKRKWWQGDEYFLDEMCVDPDTRHGGIGSTLVEFAENNLYQEDVKSIITLTAKGYPAERFYEKTGFEKSIDTILMYKVIEK